DARGQRRPSFLEAAPPELAGALYEEFAKRLRALGVPVETGVFRAHMEVELVNDGPVTILLDSAKLF
ncbi:MAG TPA: D-aminoacyl-tRNA deacylase, partial [Candidatus Acidoferrales bacterium]|nr:D-aminoacyl-tRNA deacylase [Candidatus Acidoferrales bacterium]